MNPFAEKYKTWSNAQLLEVIDLPENYQPEAVNAAEAELAVRHVPADELAEIRLAWQAVKNRKAAKAEKIKALENKVWEAGAEFAAFVQPNVAPTPLNKVIAAISIVFGAIGLYQIYLLIKYLIEMIRYSFPFFSSVMVPLIFGSVYLPLTALWFWKRMKWGWIFLGIYLVFMTLDEVVFTAIRIYRHSKYDYYPDTPGLYIFTALQLLFYGAIIWFVFGNKIREAYTIDKRSVAIALSAGLVASLIIMGSIMHF